MQEAESEARPVLDVDADRDRVPARRLSQRAPQRLLGLLKMHSREDRSFVIHESNLLDADPAFYAAYSLELERVQLLCSRESGDMAFLPDFVGSYGKRSRNNGYMLHGALSPATWRFLPCSRAESTAP